MLWSPLLDTSGWMRTDLLDLWTRSPSIKPATIQDERQVWCRRECNCPHYFVCRWKLKLSFLRCVGPVFLLWYLMWLESWICFLDEFRTTRLSSMPRWDVQNHLRHYFVAWKMNFQAPLTGLIPIMEIQRIMMLILAKELISDLWAKLSHLVLETGPKLLEWSTLELHMYQLTIIMFLMIVALMLLYLFLSILITWSHCPDLGGFAMNRA